MRTLVKNRRLLPVIIIAMAVCVAAFLYNIYRDLTQVEYGENETSVSWLPATASHVSYYRSYSRTAYEFDMAEQDFIAFAESKGWQMRRIEQEPFTIRRYRWCRESVPPNSLPATATNVQITAMEANLSAYAAITTKRISDGFVYDVRQNNGGGTLVTYDASLKRAYVFTTPR